MFSEINIQELESEEVEKIADEITAVLDRVAFSEFFDRATLSEGVARGSPKEEVTNCLFDYSEFYIDNQNILSSNNEASIVCLMNPIRDSQITQMARLVGITDNYAFQITGTIEDIGSSFSVLASAISVFPKQDFEDVLTTARDLAAAEFLDGAIRHAFSASKMPPDVLTSRIEKTVQSIPEVKAFLDAQRLMSIANQGVDEAGAARSRRKTGASL